METHSTGGTVVEWFGLRATITQHKEKVSNIDHFEPW